MLKGKRLVFALGVTALAVFLIFFGAAEKTEEEQATASDTRAEIEALCSSVEGVGKCRVTVVFEPDGVTGDEERVYSVAVVCEGGDSIYVRARLIELITTLYGIGSNRVSVMKLQK